MAGVLGADRRSSNKVRKQTRHSTKTSLAVELLESRTLLDGSVLPDPRVARPEALAVEILGEFQGEEGIPMSFRVSHETPGTTYHWEVRSSAGRLLATSGEPELTFTPNEDGPSSLSLRIGDPVLGQSFQSIPLDIANAPPQIDDITITRTDLERLITLSAQFHDPGTSDVLTTHWDVIENRTGEAVLRSSAAEFSFKLRRRGTFTALLRVTDEDGAVTTTASEFVVGNVEVPTATTSEYFIGQLYIELLQRQPDARGLEYWTTMLNAGMSRVEVISTFQQTLEYKTQVVRELYKNYLQRTPGSMEVDFFVQLADQRVTWEDIKTVFLGSPEFQFLHGGTTQGLLQALYEDVLKRAPDADGIRIFSAALNAGVPVKQVAEVVLKSDEGIRQRVLDWYAQFLQRPPKPSSMRYWSSLLREGQRDEDVLATIVGSDEYFTGL